jgi:hypothetical protein
LTATDWELVCAAYGATVGGPASPAAERFREMTDHTESEVAEIHGYADPSPEPAIVCDVCGNRFHNTAMCSSINDVDLSLCLECVTTVEKQEKAAELERALVEYPGLRDRYETAQAKKRAE